MLADIELTPAPFDSADADKTPVSIVIERAPSGTTDFTEIASLPADGTNPVTYQDDVPPPLSDYIYRGAAVNADGDKSTYIYGTLAGPQAGFAFVVEPSTGRVTFDALDSAAGTTGAGPNASYAWDFGDGGQATGAQVDHVYQAPGPFNVKLTVTDPDIGLGDTHTRQVAPSIADTADLGGIAVGALPVVESTDTVLSLTALDGGGFTDPGTVSWEFASGEVFATAANATESYQVTMQFPASGEQTVLAVFTPDGGGTPQTVGRTFNVQTLTTAYASKAAGDDANDGRSQDSPVETLGQLRVVMDGTEVTSGRLQSGNAWREALRVKTGEDVAEYGTGGLPLVDHSDIVPNASWQKVDGYTNLYLFTSTQGAAGDSSRYGTWVDGVRLARAADYAEAEATPGSMVDRRRSQGSPVEYVIHPPGSTDPRTDGKTYEVSRRGTLRVDDGGIVEGVHTRRNVSNNGAIDAGRDAYVGRVVASEGTKHNALIESGLMESAFLFAEDAPFPPDEPTATFAVAYAIDATGLEVTFRRVHCVQPDSLPNAWNGLYAHSSNDPVDRYKRFNVEGGSAYRMRAALGGVAEIVDVKGLIVHQAAMGGLVGDRHTYAYCVVQNDGSEPTFKPQTNLTGGAASLLVDNCAYVGDATDTTTKFGVLYIPSGFTAQVHNCIIAMQGDNVKGIDANGALDLRRSVIVPENMGSTQGVLIDVTSGYTGDHNIFVNTQYDDFLYDGQNVALDDWVSVTGQDQNSGYVNWDNLWLGIVEGKNRGPIDGDFRIDPNVPINALDPNKRAAHSGDARFGTFPDGTTIDEVGLTMVWDHADAGLIEGSLNGFPVMPRTLAEGLAFSENPDTWDYGNVYEQIAGSGAGSGGGTTNPALDAPTGLTSSVINDNDITLSWNAVVGASGYAVYIDDGGGPVQDGTTSGESSTSFTVSGLPDGTYTLHVTTLATDAPESAPSATVNETIDTATPPDGGGSGSGGSGSGGTASGTFASTPTKTWTFDGTSLDLTEWEGRKLGPRKGAESTMDAVEVSGGTLKLYLYSDPNDEILAADGNGVDEYTPHKAAMIRTKDQFMYGRFEIDVVRSEPAFGAYQAWWMQAPNMTQASVPGEEEQYGAEFTVIEQRGNKKYNGNHGLHWIGYASPNDPDKQDDWHHHIWTESAGVMTPTQVQTWAFEWTPDELRHYVGGELMWTVRDGELAPDEFPNAFFMISDTEEYWILSTECHMYEGRGFAGHTPDDFGPKGASTNSILEVSEMRYYAYNPDGSGGGSSGGGGGGGGSTTVYSPDDVSGSHTDGDVTLTWTAEPGAEEYWIYEYQTDDFRWIGRTNSGSDESYNVGVRSDGTWRYIVRSVVNSESITERDEATVVIDSGSSGGSSGGSGGGSGPSGGSLSTFSAQDPPQMDHSAAIQASHITLPMIGTLVQQVHKSNGGGLAPNILFHQQHTPYNDYGGQILGSSDKIASNGKVPFFGLQGWTNQYEDSLAGGSLADNDGHVAWVDFVDNHPQYLTRAPNGQTLGWKGTMWGYQHPGTPLDSADIPSGVTGSYGFPPTFGDWIADRLSSYAARFNIWGAQMSDFWASLPHEPIWVHSFDQKIIDHFASHMSLTVPQGTISERSTYILNNYRLEWYDYSCKSMARSLALWTKAIGEANGQPGMMLNQNAFSAPKARNYAYDPRHLVQAFQHYGMDPAQMVVNANFWWRFETKGGNTEDPESRSNIDFATTVAREPRALYIAAIESEYSGFWSTVDNVYTGLSFEDRREIGRKRIKRQWMEAGLAHAATADGKIRRCAEALQCSQHNRGTIDPEVRSVIRGLYPVRPHGVGVYHSTGVEDRWAEGERDMYRMTFEDICSVREEGYPFACGYSTPHLDNLRDWAKPTAFIVPERYYYGSDALPQVELDKLTAIAPVYTESAAKGANIYPLSFSAADGRRIVGFSFFDTSGALVVVISHKIPIKKDQAAAITSLGSGTDVTIRFHDVPGRLPDGSYTAQAQFASTGRSFSVTGSTGSFTVPLARYDTEVYKITPAS